MTTQFGQREPRNTLGQGKEWVILGTNQNVYNRGDVTAGLHQTKLRFNDAMPPSVQNRATRVGPPTPIVIEKLMPRSEDRENVQTPRSSISFSAVSEERLVAAVQLAKRDLRRTRDDAMKNALVKKQQGIYNKESNHIDQAQQNAATVTMKSKSITKEKATHLGTKLLVPLTPQKHCSSHSVRVGQSPPTRDPSLAQLSRGPQAQLSQEIRKLQIELALCIQTTEKLANKDKIMEDPLEPEEQRKIDVRRQKQEARSLRIIYVLQQQVKEIQEVFEKLRAQNKWNAKKSTVVARLAAVHRGSVRAMQAFTQQLLEPSDVKVPSHYKDLGQLIRQLSLCTAKVEGSALPEATLDVLQKLEMLESALDKQERSQQRQVRAHSSSPPPRKPPQGGVPAPCLPRGPVTSGPRGPHRAAGPRKIIRGRRMISWNPADRKQLFRAGLERLDQQRAPTQNTPKVWVPKTANKQRGALQPERNQVCDAGFRQPTVSSRLRESQLTPKDPSVPWIPTSPHSPPRPQRSPQSRSAQPRCLFSPPKPSQRPPSPQLTGAVEAEHLLASDKLKQAQDEALRHAWLDQMTAQRLRALNQLSKEEGERIQRLRSEVGSPTQWAQRAEQQARQRIQPLLEQAQQIGTSRRRDGSSIMRRLCEQAAERAAGDSADQLSESLLEDLLDDTAKVASEAREGGRASCLLRAPTLDSMLQRMEEMQRDQEEVRRRFATIAYSDPLSWDRVEGTALPAPQGHPVSSRPASPQPIRLTRPVLRHSPAADIVLGEPVETGVVSDSSLTEDGAQHEQQPPRSTTVFPVERSRGRLVSVPGTMLGSIRRYRESYEAYLRLVAHEAVGGFNPWAVADGLADELLSEALGDVAAEFQDVCEEYADAVFTSEFLQPTQSPPAFPAFPLGSQ